MNIVKVGLVLLGVFALRLLVPSSIQAATVPVGCQPGEWGSCCSGGSSPRGNRNQCNTTGSFQCVTNSSTNGLGNCFVSPTLPPPSSIPQPSNNPPPPPTSCQGGTNAGWYVYNTQNFSSCTGSGSSYACTTTQSSSCNNGTAYLFYCPSGLDASGRCLQNQQSLGSFNTNTCYSLTGFAGSRTCGAIQIDFNAEGTAPSQGGCGAAVILSYAGNCTGTGGGPTAPPGGGGGSSTPTPTPKPTPTPTPIGPQCIKIDGYKAADNSALGAATKKGDAVYFLCADASAQAAKGTTLTYQFRVLEPNDDANPTFWWEKVLTANGRRSANYTIVRSGTTYAQCRICVGGGTTGAPTCAAWEPVSVPIQQNTVNK